MTQCGNDIKLFEFNSCKDKKKKINHGGFLEKKANINKSDKFVPGEEGMNYLW